MSQAVTIIGSTGSIGRQTLDVIRKHPDKWQVMGIGAYSNIDLLEEQIEEFKPEVVAVYDEMQANILQQRLQNKSHAKNLAILSGNQGWIDLGTHINTQKVVFASTGTKALGALKQAIKAKKQIALANKEMIVEEGEEIMQLANQNNVKIIPIDSEHSAIFQCIQGEDPKNIEKIILTCSGGPFLGKCEHELQNISCDQALNHPTWKMGDKISIDSATLMNKGFELIEAKYLFGIEEDKIEILIHPECIVHSFVQFRDGSIKAQLGVPDMKIPITYALSYPERIETNWERVDFTKLSKLTFKKPDYSVFQGPKLSLKAIKQGGKTSAKLRKANDEAVEQFLAKKIKFNQIYEHICTKTGL